jgi:hypothetical protein
MRLLRIRLLESEKPLTGLEKMAHVNGSIRIAKTGSSLDGTTARHLSLVGAAGQGHRIVIAQDEGS